MNKSLTRAVAVGAVCAAALAGSLTTGSTAVADGGSAKKGLTKFGYKANVFGTKLVANGIDVKSVKDALAQQKCTRELRREIVKASPGISNIIPADLPGDAPASDLIHVSPSASRTKTYRTGKSEYGVLGTNIIADITVGGLLDGVQTPVLKIEGLKSVADSWNDTRANKGHGKFHAAAEFGFGGIDLELNGVDPTGELDDLLDIIESNLPIETVVQQIIELLETVGVIEIPGLGSIALGHSVARAGAHSAEANVYALKITVQPDGAGKTVLQLGRAYSRVTDGVKSGVFRSQMSALDANVGGLVTLGGVSTQTIPCEGTRGAVKTKRVALAAIPGVIELSGIKYSWMGKQLAKGKSTSFMKTDIARVEIPVGDVVVTGLTSRLDLRSPGKNQLVKRDAKVTAAKIVIGGKTIPTPKPGQEVGFDGGSLVLRKLQHSNFNGTDLYGLVITLFEENLVVSLGEASGRIWYR